MLWLPTIKPQIDKSECQHNDPALFISIKNIYLILLLLIAAVEPLLEKLSATIFLTIY